MAELEEEMRPQVVVGVLSGIRSAMPGERWCWVDVILDRTPTEVSEGTPALRIVFPVRKLVASRLKSHLFSKVAVEMTFTPEPADEVSNG